MRTLKLLFGIQVVLHCLGMCSWADNPAANARQADARQIEFFEAKVRPVLAEHCYDCHSEDEASGGLQLDNRASLRRGGESGRAIVPGQPDKSLLIKAIRYKDEFLQMPPDDRLPEQIVHDLEQWVKIGAPDPRAGADTPPAGAVADEASRHWAFVPPEKPVIPQTKNRDWPRSDIDRLILARLEAKGITPSADAAPEILVRRLYFDLIGLPPTYDEVQAYCLNKSPDAYERIVDRLLDSPNFGERWARYWLDVSRFSDTKGYVFREDRNYPNAFKYRDWVITAFNEDMPVNKFLQYQLAADRLVEEGDREDLAALGYVTLGRRFINNVHDIIDDRIDVVSRGMLGLTVTCARCHDHKYDPITMKDYYGLYGVFFSSADQQDDDLPLRLIDKERPVDVSVFIRGNPAARGDPSPRGYLDYFVTSGTPAIEQGSGRLELARAIASQDNPLTARVFVNRVWMHLFGEGLVRTPSDFGLRSDPPAQPEALDWLAVRFMEDGWSLKALVREIVNSSVYRQQSDVRREPNQADPENLLFWRADRRRLDFEAMRDSMLSVSGQLDRTIGGPSVALGPDNRRRTLYAFLDRQNLPSVFRTFDFAGPDTHSPGRPRTTVPQQALYMMNNAFAQTTAERLVERVAETSDTEAKIRQLYRYALSRDPREEELQIGIEFVAQGEGVVDKPERSRWEFGYGTVHDEGTVPQVEFHALPHFSGDAWQGGPERPDPKLGWVIVTATGGHPGNDQQHAAIRRWTSPQRGKLVVTGELKHASDQGDGVRGRIVSSRLGVVDQWVVKNNAKQTTVSSIEVEPGEIIDFVTDCQAHSSFDSFTWTATLDLNIASDMPKLQWPTADGFHGPAPRPLDVWQRYAQVLILTNEFLFLD